MTSTRASAWHAPPSAWTLAISVAVSACDCEGTGVSSGSSSLRASTAVLDFGRVFVGKEKVLAFELTAPGEAPVAYAAHLGGDAFGYLLGPATGTLAASTGRTITVVFRPGAVGPANARAIFDSDARDGARVVVELLGVGAPLPDCEDGNGCTSDRFDLELERCTHRPEPYPCEDFSACTTSDRCVEGVCLGQSVGCDDLDSCTDDFCDPRAGCVNPLTARCDDDNTCTLDRCTGEDGCTHETLDDGTPCDDAVPCTVGDICFAGRCIGVNIEDGTPCDDHDPCSKNDQCLAGICRDPDYRKKSPGELKFSTRVGPLAPGAAENPIVDRDSTTWVGTRFGLAGVDQCGAVVLTSTIGTPLWSGALMQPGRLMVPVRQRLVEVETVDGTIQKDLDLSVIFPRPVPTASVSVQVVDLAARPSGALVASVARRAVLDGTETIDGALAEIDPLGVVTKLMGLGPSIARRVVIDADESLLLLLHEGWFDEPALERVARLDLDGGSSWSSSEASQRTEVAIDAHGRSVWTDGLVRFDRIGSLERVFSPSQVIGGAVLGRRGTYLIQRDRDEDTILSITESGSIEWSRGIPASAGGWPAIDGLENVFVATADGRLLGTTLTGSIALSLSLPVVPDHLDRPSVTLSSAAVIIVVADAHVIGVQWGAALSGGPWPRIKRDNLATAHR
ncbi:MAG: hypothetical protein HYV07_26525 [Deltaproteobacteria bacterium]|nr:hypothetical protein [Deltaproteobacteria bacterium]